jgi:hypothetical protein
MRIKQVTVAAVIAEPDQPASLNVTANCDDILDTIGVLQAAIGLLEAQWKQQKVAEEQSAQRAAEYNRGSALRRMELPTVGPTTWDAAKETGNYGDYVQNVLGGMAGSMVKPLVGSSIGGLVGGLPGAAVGGFGGSFSAIRNAELENYANDEQLKTLSPAEQLRVTRNSAALQALPEAIMPAYLGAGGRLPGALNRVPTALRVAGSLATESGTEGLQDYISQRVAQSQFPDREIDWNSVHGSTLAAVVATQNTHGATTNKASDGVLTHAVPVNFAVRKLRLRHTLADVVLKPFGTALCC